MGATVERGRRSAWPCSRMHHSSTVSRRASCEGSVKEGVPGRIFYIVVEGQAKIVRRGRTIGRAGPGDSFGEMAILTTSPRSASVVAETPMEVLTLSGSHLRTILLEQPRIAVRLLDTLATRLADLDRRFTA